MGGTCSAYGVETYTWFWRGNLRERDNVGRPRHRWEDNIKMVLQKVGCGAVDWTELARDAVMSLGVP